MKSFRRCFNYASKRCKPYSLLSKKHERWKKRKSFLRFAETVNAAIRLDSRCFLHDFPHHACSSAVLASWVLTAFKLHDRYAGVRVFRGFILASARSLGFNIDFSLSMLICNQSVRKTATLRDPKRSIRSSSLGCAMRLDRSDISDRWGSHARSQSPNMV